MKKLAFGALFVGLLVACGGGDDNKIKLVDTNTVDTPSVCNPLTQAGCMAGEKCTWLLDALMPQYVGHVGCAPDGTAAQGEACMYGAPGASGYDNCKSGLVCGNYRGGAGTCTPPMRPRMIFCRRSSRAGGRAGLYTRGLISAQASSAACSRVNAAADTPKCVRAAASAPQTPSPHSTTLR